MTRAFAIAWYVVGGDVCVDFELVKRLVSPTNEVRPGDGPGVCGKVKVLLYVLLWYSSLRRNDQEGQSIVQNAILEP